MNKVKPIEVAKWFMNQDIEGINNSKNGNMKLQKLLFFSQIMYMCKNNGNTMFDEQFNAFKDGMILQEVLWKYQNNYKELEQESEKEIKLPSDVKEILIATKEIFGSCTAQELLNMTHELKAWDKYYKKSILIGGKKYTSSKSKIPYEEFKDDLYRMEKILDAYYREPIYQTDNDEEDY